MITSKNIGLFFGSFNPVHTGHLIIAEYMVTQTDLEELWMVVSPHNPLKDRKNLAKDYDRLHLLELALEDNYKIKPSNIEFSLPKPSYTVDTLTYLKEKYPQHAFNLIMGSDNLRTFYKWKNYEVILKNYGILVYTRPGYEKTQFDNHPSVTIVQNVPLMHISASFIRKLISQDDSIKYLVPQAVEEYIKSSRMYKD